MNVPIQPLRFVFRAIDPIASGDSGFANVLRGALGMVLAERPEYSRIFAPQSTKGPSGFADAPRPYILRAGFGRETIVESHCFGFDVHVFGNDPAIARTITDSFVDVCARGIGVSRGRAQLEKLEILQSDGSIAQELGRQPNWSTLKSPWLLEWPAEQESISRLRVKFVTPTELKSEGRVSLQVPEYSLLIARARDRLSSLSLHYGEPSADVDYKGLLERARAVRIVDSAIEHHYAQRFSTRTRQSHPLSGFLGSVVYEGPVAESVGLLRAAYWTGVGRQTVWGHGAVVVE